MTYSAGWWLITISFFFTALLAGFNIGCWYQRTMGEDQE